MCVQSTMIVLETSHFDSGVLTNTILEGVQLIWVGHLHHHRANRVAEARANYLETLVHGHVMVIDSQLIVQVFEELVFLSLRHARLLQQLVNCLAIQSGLILLIVTEHPSFLFRTTTVFGHDF